MLRCFKQCIPLPWKHEAVHLLSPFRPPDVFPAEGPRLIVALAADYANLGDVAITCALTRFVQRHFPTHQPYLLCAGQVFRQLRGVSRAASKEDFVAIVGGGNMGDRYPDLEEARCRVVRACCRNRVVSFPQSIDFSNTALGHCALARSRAAYESHPGLILFAREEGSFVRMREAFPHCDVRLAPDTVLSMNPEASATRDLPLLVCLRQDAEASISSSRRTAILGALESLGPGIRITDTLVPGPRLSYPEYEQHLNDLWSDFSRANCVVTDRLHGLIFSVIHRTPCVVIENSNHKIRSTWQTWLSDLPSIRLLTDPEPGAVVAAVREISGYPATLPQLNAAFAPLAEALRP